MTKKIASFVFLISSDFAAVLLSFYLAFLIRSEVFPQLFPIFLERPVFFSIFLGRAYWIVLWIIVLFYERTYTKRITLREETLLLIKGTTISFAFVMIAVFATQQYLEFSRLIIVFAWLFSLVLVPLLRYMTKLLIINFNLWRKRVVIVSTANTIPPIIEAIHKNKTLGYEIVGCLTGKRDEIGNVISGVKIYGHYGMLEKWKEKLQFEDIIVSLPDLSREEFISLMKQWDQLSETIRYIPQMGDLITAGVEIENIGPVLSLSLRKNLYKPWNILIKTVFEYFLTLVLFVLFFPILLVIAVAIRMDSRGPVFFIQERYGKKGRAIKVVKFRSMYVDADSRLEQYLEKKPEAKEEWEQYKKLRNFDPRVTRVGRVLRKYSLDELPQFLNVLKGAMSLVGPRPYIMEELKKVESAEAFLLLVKPGITGLWQVSGRSLLPFSERLNLDEYYLRNWTFWLDLTILARTVKVFLSGEGAY